MARTRESSEVQKRKYSISALALTMQIPICRRVSILRSKAKQDNERTSKNFKVNTKCFKCEWKSRSMKELFAEKPQE